MKVARHFSAGKIDEEAARPVGTLERARDGASQSSLRTSAKAPLPKSVILSPSKDQFGRL